MNICVYGAASRKINSEYLDATQELGEEIAKRGHTLVFGGGSEGVMGATARGVKKAGGKVIGVVPEFFKEEVIEPIFEECDELIWTDSMKERKHTMEEKADAFVVAPGGIGTMEEFFETLTLKQLGRHKKPIAIYNVDSFYDYIKLFMYKAMDRKFIKSNCDLLYLTFTDLDEMFDYLEHLEGSFGMGVHDFK